MYVYDAHVTNNKHEPVPRAEHRRPRCQAHPSGFSMCMPELFLTVISLKQHIVNFNKWCYANYIQCYDRAKRSARVH